MTAIGWRRLSILLGAVCVVQCWRSCAHPSEPAPPSIASRADCAAAITAGRAATTPVLPVPDERSRAAPPAGGFTAYGFSAPSWVRWFAPQPGEDLRAYRDRMLPLARAAVAPHRARVARSRDGFAQLAQLDTRQRGELDASVADTASALQDRVLTAVLGGELSPATFKPMAGVALARDLVDLVDRGNRRFLDTLRPNQRDQLAHHPFDFGDYLIFSTPWEDALQLLGP